MNNYKNYCADGTRLKGYDYSWDGLYFVTICTKDKECYLGTITDGVVNLSDTGKLLLQYWQEISVQFEYTFLGEYIIMPNHIHGIIGINNTRKNEIHYALDNNNTRRDVIHYVSDSINTVNDVIHHVSDNNNSSEGVDENTSNRDKLKSTSDSIIVRGGITGEHNPMLSNHHLGKIIRWFKGRCTFEVRKQLNIPFQWQPGYYEHIIRTRQALINIENYIINNPFNWHTDENNQLRTNR